jgi:imidazole glycerol-phosphate synthase subunit HisF
VAIDAARAPDDAWRVRAVAATEDTGRDALVWAREAVERGAGELLVTSIDRDGTRSGYDLALTGAMAGEVRVPVIASGGAGSAGDVADVLEAGASAALLASTLHFGILHIGPLKEALVARGLSIRMPAPVPSPEEVAAWLG